jgi:ABC-type antimicrobial peptide transport system permease subunit
VSGLFSVLSYIVAQQTKEIGLRVTLGATTKTVARFVIGQAFRSVGIRLAIGAGLAAALATVLLSAPAASDTKPSCASSIRLHTSPACS